MKKIFPIIIFLLLSLIYTDKTWATEASLKCSPSTGTYKIGDTFDISYLLDTRTFDAYGAVISATYDGTVLEAVGTQSTPITSVSQWGQPAVNTIDPATATIKLDYGNSQPAYKGSSVIGKATFKASAAGQAQFNYVFFQQYDDTTPGVAKVYGKKDGTNITNILTDVNNCIYVVEPSTPTATTAPGMPTATPKNPTPTLSIIPPLGGGNTTLSLLGISILMISAGIILPLLSFKSRVFLTSWHNE